MIIQNHIKMRELPTNARRFISKGNSVIVYTSVLIRYAPLALTTFNGRNITSWYDLPPRTDLIQQTEAHWLICHTTWLIERM